jgi:EAL domain-containing protein (putative c-di-GMP-specific phosphodiesterase class I)
MSYLARFRVDVLKIDKAFVHGSTGRGRHRAIVKSIIALAHDLGIQVVAEGVESAAQLRQLRALRCDAIQGYHFRPPMTPTDLTALLATEAGSRRASARRPPSQRARA